jgi:hypothetical protein
MMTLLAKGLGWLLGSNALPLGLAGALLLVGHQWWQERDRNLELAGTRKCEDAHALALAKAERDSARQELAAYQQQLEDERRTQETLRHERETIRSEFAEYRKRASADPRCLSDGVLDLLRGHGEVGGAGKR